MRFVVYCLFILAVSWAPSTAWAGGGTIFTRADTNNDGLVGLADAGYLINALFQGGPAVVCDDAADTEDDGDVDDDDIFYLLNWFFPKGPEPSPAPPPPFRIPGPDPTSDGLGCARGAGAGAGLIDVELDCPGPPEAVPGEEVTFTVRGSFSKGIEGFSIHLLLDTEIASLERVDLEGVLPTDLRDDFENSPFFRVRVEPTVGGDIVEVGAILVDDRFQTLDIPLSSGAGRAAPLVRLIVRIREDVEVEGRQTLFTPASAPPDGLGITTELIQDGLAVFPPSNYSCGVTIIKGEFFIRGNANDDASVNIADLSFIANWVFGVAPATPPRCLRAANANGDRSVNIADVSYLANFIFGVAPATAPPAPYPGCGSPGGESLACNGSLSCRN